MAARWPTCQWVLSLAISSVRASRSFVRMPGRSFPGVLIQGDGLSVIRTDVASIRDACQTQGATEALELVQLLLEDLDAIIQRYTDALDRHDLRKPF